MSVLIDSSIIVALLIETDAKHQRAMELFQSFKDNKLGKLYVTDFVLDDVLTHIWVSVKRKNLVEIAYEILMDLDDDFYFINDLR